MGQSLHATIAFFRFFAPSKTYSASSAKCTFEGKYNVVTHEHEKARLSKIISPFPLKIMFLTLFEKLEFPEKPNLFTVIGLLPVALNVTVPTAL